jgi:hypothetical protein
MEMKKQFIALLSGTLLMMATSAMATNLLVNGSFEDFGNNKHGLDHWSTTTSSKKDPYPVAVIKGTSGNGYSKNGGGGAFGEEIPVDDIVGGSPDAAGSHEVYFVSDSAHQHLSQSVYLSTGRYEIGFDAYLPRNGYENPYDATFNAFLKGSGLGNMFADFIDGFTVKTSEVANWLHFSDIADITNAGYYLLDFEFQPDGGCHAAADVIIDRVYVESAPAPVPEPGTMMLLGVGLCGLALFGKRRINKEA